MIHFGKAILFTPFKSINKQIIFPISVIGNLKFSNETSLEIKELQNFTSRTYVLAASTHDDEEYQLAKMWKGINNQEQLLVIAPRHPDRTESILHKLKSRMNPSG